MGMKQKEFLLYTSINPRKIESQLANIQCWTEFECVQGVRLIQSAREYPMVSEYLANRDEKIQISIANAVNGKAREAENPKGLPSLRDVLECMVCISREEEAGIHHGYLNSDIVLRDARFFVELSCTECYISMIHRMDIEASEEGERHCGFYMHGVDGFFVSDMLLKKVRYGSAESFYLGLPGWDQYMPLLCWLNGWEVKYITSVFAVHRVHATSNPGSYSLFACRLIVVYIREYYIGGICRLADAVRLKLPWRRASKLVISIAHKLIIFTALRALGWKIQRRPHMFRNI
jgi:hypothetical protein